MIGVANVNGIITDIDKAVIPVLDRGTHTVCFQMLFTFFK